MRYPNENAGNNILHTESNIGKGKNNIVSTSNGLKNHVVAGERDKTRTECKASQLMKGFTCYSKES